MAATGSLRTFAVSSPPKKATVPRRSALLLLMPDPVNAWT
jgi:hypothetical protein